MKYTHFQSKQKALDLAFWLNHVHRRVHKEHVVVHGPENDFVVMAKTEALENEFTIIDELPENFSNLDYQAIEDIRTDEEPLGFWEDLNGSFSVMSNDLLRFILQSHIPIDKLVRYELAIRGFDDNGEWIGFEEAKKLWLK